MSEFNVRGMLTAAPAASGSPLPPGGKPAELSPAARLVAAQPIAAVYSPIVVAGFVRMIEFALLAVIGNAIYFAYVFPVYGFDWYYPATAIGMAAVAMLAFQAADIYQVQAFRSPFSQCARLVLAWSIVYLLAVSMAFFAQLGPMYSRL